MKIVENSNPKWTIPRIDALEKYGSNCLDLDKQIDAKDIANQKIKISQGVPDPAVPPNVSVFEIYDNNGKHTGDIYITKFQDGLHKHELSIVMFNENSHLSKHAIKMVLDKLKEKKVKEIITVVLKINPHKDKMLHILDECGFNIIEDSIENITLINFLTSQSS